MVGALGQLCAARRCGRASCGFEQALGLLSSSSREAQQVAAATLKPAGLVRLLKVLQRAPPPTCLLGLGDDPANAPAVGLVISLLPPVALLAEITAIDLEVAASRAKARSDSAVGKVQPVGPVSHSGFVKLHYSTNP